MKEPGSDSDRKRKCEGRPQKAGRNEELNVGFSGLNSFRLHQHPFEEICGWGGGGGSDTFNSFKVECLGKYDLFI